MPFFSDCRDVVQALLQCPWRLYVIVKHVHVLACSVHFFWCTCTWDFMRLNGCSAQC